MVVALSVLLGHQGPGELRRRETRGVQTLRDAEGAREEGVPEESGPGEEGERGEKDPGVERETPPAPQSQCSGKGHPCLHL